MIDGSNKDGKVVMMLLEVARVPMLGLVNLLKWPGYGFHAKMLFLILPTLKLYSFFFFLIIIIIQVMEIKSDKLKGKNSRRMFSVTKSKRKLVNKISSNCTLPLITPFEYASWSAMLHSLVVAWSPMLRLSSKNCPILQNGSSNQFSVLAIGGKSGKISFWRIFAPKCYSIEHSKIDTTLVQVGLLQAHNSWITAISWALLSSNSSNPQVLLVTGSSDGSVRIWTGYSEELLNSVEVHHAPFSILKEVITINNVPIYVLSLCVPARSSHQMLLAIGKGSGSFDVWICDISSNKFDKAGSYDAHDQVVTGLAWAFDGSSLYSCSQDNFVRSWVLYGNTLSEVPIPSNTPGLKSPTDLPDVFVSCLGLAVSPGNLILAMVRNFDLDSLDHMYQARAHKAAIEFFWIGGQQLDVLPNTSRKYGLEAFPDFSEKELASWESNILWSLKQYEDQDKPLVVWDVIVALLAFKRSIPKYVECALLKWLSTFYPGSHVSCSTEKVLSNLHKNLSKNSSRRLHLLNIICRYVMLTEVKADDINNKHQKSRRLCGSEEEQLTVWMELLLNSERELRQRLVSLSFSAFITLTSHSTSTSVQASCWCPDGISQMEHWVAHNYETSEDQLKALASEVVGRRRRILSTKYVEEEKCSYCLAPVPFNSPEVAVCQGSQNHKLVRCAVSMQVCPTTPLWFCKCCHRQASKLASESLFKMPKYPVDFKNLKEYSVQEEISKPLCPFCGILLQRLQPEFLLSASPV
ncbi:hypothetical protein Pint_05181 [Pistacia integerrima]|uniref:Uncharacterized protein n=1 Tax=Pistacia integerrima TaxID=434235 RepID=A0ACC0Z2U3_9ROSI|nr:hypothetical protein Pint_05181 [Pistacia integerrima]